jgi:hypothetical protein
MRRRGVITAAVMSLGGSQHRIIMSHGQTGSSFIARVELPNDRPDSATTHTDEAWALTRGEVVTLGIFRSCAMPPALW